MIQGAQQGRRRKALAELIVRRRAEEVSVVPYRIRWEGHGVYRRFFGIITMDDFRRAHAEIAGDIRYDGIRYIISDFLGAQAGGAFRAREVEEFAELEQLKFYSSPDIVNAAVVTDETILAHVRHFGSLNVSPYPLGIFRTVEEARRWIAANPRLGWHRALPKNEWRDAAYATH
jgi:hypothetical protein